MEPEERLAEMLKRAGVAEKASYLPSEAARALGVSRSQIYRMTVLFEPGRGGLDSFLLGKHRRIPHDALLSFLRENRTHEREHRG